MMNFKLYCCYYHYLGIGPSVSKLQAGRGYDFLNCCGESSVDFLVMDSRALFHTTHDNKTFKNLKVGDFGKVRLANIEVLDVTRMS